MSANAPSTRDIYRQLNSNSLFFLSHSLDEFPVFSVSTPLIRNDAAGRNYIILFNQKRSASAPVCSSIEGTHLRQRSSSSRREEKL